jgi:hypothetical protein
MCVRSHACTNRGSCNCWLSFYDVALAAHVGLFILSDATSCSATHEAVICETALR